MEEEGDGSPEPCPLPLQHLPGAKVRIHKHQPSKLTGYAQEEGMNQAANLTTSSGLFQAEVWGVRGEESCIGNLPPPPHSQPSLLCCLWTVAQLVGEEGRR